MDTGVGQGISKGKFKKDYPEMDRMDRIELLP